MSDRITRRTFAGLGSGVPIGSASLAMAVDGEKLKPPTQPTEAPLVRDYPEPKFKPSWKKPQINREMARDLVIYAHSELDLLKMMLAKKPSLLNACIDWGDGDWETGLGSA